MIASDMLNQAWQSYRASVVPADAGKIQVEETHKAFIAGASVMFETVFKLSANDSVTEETSFLILESIQKELAQTVKMFTGNATKQ